MKIISSIVVWALSVFVCSRANGSGPPEAIRFPGEIRRSSFERNADRSPESNVNFRSVRNDSRSSRLGDIAAVAAANAKRPATSTDCGTKVRKTENTDETTAADDDPATVDSRFLVQHARRPKTAYKSCPNGQTRTFSGECKQAFVDYND